MDTHAVIALIEAVKQYPSLYLKQPVQGGNSDQKNIIWRDIAQKIDQPIDKCKAKWRNLRDSYHKAIKWRQELDAIGKLSNYHEYKHEAALSFLGSTAGIKRKSSSDGVKQLKLSKRPKEDIFEPIYTVDTQDYSSSHGVEYLIETDQNESQPEDDVDEGEEQMLFTVSGDDEHNLNDIPADHIIESGNPEDQDEKKFFADPQNEEVSYQEAYINESHSNSNLDNWLTGIKETLLSFPKLLRARAKKQINDLVSEFEISYLETIDGKT